MYKLMQEAYLDGEKYTIVMKTEEEDKETRYTLKDEKCHKYAYNVAEHRLTLTPPNAFTHEEFRKVFDSSAVWRSDYTLKDLHEFVEECFRSKKCIN